ncbi:hypothetical protein MMC26_005610 [Xylographa opegraphella]|nr:hypothetical protein [Xylographa opegraphella]
MDIIKTIFPCIPAPRKMDLQTSPIGGQRFVAEKQPFLPNQSAGYPTEKQPLLSTQEASTQIITVILTSTVKGPSLDSQIQDIVYQAGGWRESLAASILSAFEQALHKAFELKEALNPIIQDAITKVMAAGRQIQDFAEWFKDEHPIWTGVILTLVALGVLWLIFPYILSALGFAETGIVRGEFWKSSESDETSPPLSSPLAFVCLKHSLAVSRAPITRAVTHTIWSTN